MKSIINKILLLVTITLAAVSCKKDETQAVLDTSGSAITLSAATNTLVLLQVNATNDAITFNWNEAEFGYDAAVTYTLQIAKKGSNFASPLEIAVGNNVASKAFKVAVINQELLKIIPYDIASDLEIRVKAEVGASAPIQYSNTFELKATPYRALINYEFPKALWVAGNYQGWAPDLAPKIVDKNAIGTTGTDYEGYINFTDGAPHDFKLVKGNNWGAGDFGSAGGTNLGNGGPNLSIPTAAGVYLLKANTVAMTWSYTKIDKWAVTGSATPLGWPAGPEGTPNQDHTMTFDPVKAVYSITLNLNPGEIKFRANNAWSLNFGENNNDGIPDYGGSNIAIAAAGSYTLTLDLGVAGNYAYSIKKN